MSLIPFKEWGAGNTRPFFIIAIAERLVQLFDHHLRHERCYFFLRPW